MPWAAGAAAGIWQMEEASRDESVQLMLLLRRRRMEIESNENTVNVAGAVVLGPYEAVKGETDAVREVEERRCGKFVGPAILSTDPNGFVEIRPDCCPLLFQFILDSFSRGFIINQSTKSKSNFRGKISDTEISESSIGLLTEEAMSAVKMLLPDYASGDMASVCSWPDEIKHHYQWRWTSPLHYVDTRDFKCNYDYCHDCHDSAGMNDRCVSGAIYNYSSQLATYQHPELEEKYNLTEALLFLSHFMGDIHQPLHVGFTGDEGGNTIIVRWYRRKSNLHHVWDNMIIETALKDFYNLDIATMVQGIQANISEQDDWSTVIPSWEDCGFNQTASPNIYASESIRLACKFTYRNVTTGKHSMR